MSWCVASSAGRSSATTPTAPTSSRALTVYAWALLPNYAHLLVQTGTRPLARAMRGTFNRRHHRGGRLFQIRHTSILVEEAAYCRELAGDIPRKPLLEVRVLASSGRIE